jgi:hypothetical protein
MDNLCSFCDIFCQSSSSCFARVRIIVPKNMKPALL